MGGQASHQNKSRRGCGSAVALNAPVLADGRADDRHDGQEIGRAGEAGKHERRYVVVGSGCRARRLRDVRGLSGMRGMRGMRGVAGVSRAVCRGVVSQGLEVEVEVQVEQWLCGRLARGRAPRRALA